VFPKIIDLSSDKNHLTRLSRLRQRLHSVVQRTLAVIATVADILSITFQIHLVRLDFLDTDTDLIRDSMRVGPIRGCE
jgi:hypothetical protein